MEEQFWLSRWKQNQIGFHQPQANPLMVAHFASIALRPGATVFVPLCGKSLDMHWLRAQGYRVAGAELSRVAVEQLFAEMGLQPHISPAGELARFEADGVTVFQGNIFELTADLLGPVDAVYDRAALVAFPKDMRDQYALHLVQITQSAPQLCICFEYDQACTDGPPFSVPEPELRAQYERSFEFHLLERKDVPGGLKGMCPATEAAWKLEPTRNHL